MVGASAPIPHFPSDKDTKSELSWGGYRTCCSVAKSYLSLCDPMDCSTAGKVLDHHQMPIPFSRPAPLSSANVYPLPLLSLKNKKKKERKKKKRENPRDGTAGQDPERDWTLNAHIATVRKQITRKIKPFTEKTGLRLKLGSSFTEARVRSPEGEHVGHSPHSWTG